MKEKLRAAAAAVLAGTMLAGCGATLHSGAMRGQADVPGTGNSRDAAVDREAQSLGKDMGTPGLGMLGPGLLGQGGVSDLLGQIRPMLRRGAARLGLTSQQKEQLAAIARARAGDRAQRRADLQKHRAELEALLKADRVDEAALRSFILARQQEASKHAAAVVDTLAQMRAVLSDPQRAELLAILDEKFTKGEIVARHKQFEGRVRPKLEEFRRSLNLTAEQREAVAALRQKIGALRKEGGPRLKEAARAFLETGDKEALKRALQESIASRIPTDELVRVAAVLDKDQRLRLVKAFSRVRERVRRGRPGHQERPGTSALPDEAGRGGIFVRAFDIGRSFDPVHFAWLGIAGPGR